MDDKFLKNLLIKSIIKGNFKACLVNAGLHMAFWHYFHLLLPFWQQTWVEIIEIYARDSFPVCQWSDTFFYIAVHSWFFLKTSQWLFALTES